MLEAEQLLLNAVFEDAEVVFLEVLRDVAAGVEHGDVERDFFDIGVDDEAAALFGDFAGGGFGGLSGSGERTGSRSTVSGAGFCAGVAWAGVLSVVWAMRRLPDRESRQIAEIPHLRIEMWGTRSVV